MIFPLLPLLPLVFSGLAAAVSPRAINTNYTTSTIDKRIPALTTNSYCAAFSSSYTFPANKFGPFKKEEKVEIDACICADVFAFATLVPEDGLGGALPVNVLLELNSGMTDVDGLDALPLGAAAMLNKKSKYDFKTKGQCQTSLPSNSHHAPRKGSCCALACDDSYAYNGLDNNPKCVKCQGDTPVVFTTNAVTGAQKCVAKCTDGTYDKDGKCACPASTPVLFTISKSEQKCVEKCAGGSYDSTGKCVCAAPAIKIANGCGCPTGYATNASNDNLKCTKCEGTTTPVVFTTDPVKGIQKCVVKCDKGTYGADGNCNCPENLSLLGGTCQCTSSQVFCGIKCHPLGYICATVGLSRRSAERNAFYCPDKMTSCPILGSSRRECVDTQSDVESCGGCFDPTNLTSGARDCTTMSGTNAVSCVRGECVIKSCQKGWTRVASPGGQKCIRKVLKDAVDLTFMRSSS